MPVHQTQLKEINDLNWARFRPEWVLVLAMLILPSIAMAQTVAPTAPDSGCYVPGTGSVYVLNEPMSPTHCFSDRHIKFAWQGGESTGAAATRVRTSSQDMASVRADLFKWMLFFWVATLVILGGLMVLLLRRQARR